MKKPKVFSYLVRVYSGASTWLRPESFNRREDAVAFAAAFDERKIVVINTEPTTRYTYGVVKRYRNDELPEEERRTVEPPSVPLAFK